MEFFLLDTNVFFDVIESVKNCSGKNELQHLRKGKCFISELTRIEIISVLGKHARGVSRQEQTCERMIDGYGGICGRKFYTQPQKGWKRKIIAEWKKLIKDIIMGNCPYFTVEILPVSAEVCTEARRFVGHALKYNFGSLDAMIVATAIEYKARTGKEITIVTRDRKLLNAIRADGSLSCLNLWEMQGKAGSERSVQKDEASINPSVC